MAAYTVFLNIGDWLSISDPPQKADIVICLGGNNDRVTRAVTLFNQGFAKKILATNNDVYTQILKLKVPPEKVIKPPWLAENTYKEGIMIAQILSKENHTSALVVSDAYHLYRVKWTLEDTLPEKVPRLYYIPSDQSENRISWWINNNSRALVLWEIPKIVYYWIWHGMLGFEDNPAWLIRMKKLF
jgi:uncharacterized SAM-binding protein YcdF (DUF218 family)